MQPARLFLEKEESPVPFEVTNITPKNDSVIAAVLPMVSVPFKNMQEFLYFAMYVL